MHATIVHNSSMKNVTFTADESLIEAARAKARSANRSLNDEFRDWLLEYVGRSASVVRAISVIDRIAEYADTGGRRFSRDEMNER